MEQKKLKIAVIGIGGRTGTMFAHELKKAGDVLGVGKEREIETIQEKKLYLKRGENSPELFEGKVINDFEFPKNFLPDIIFLTTKNPVGPVVKYYYQIMKEKGGEMPTLFLSQNGIVASDEAKKALKEVFGEEAEKIQVIKISLFNPVDREIVGEKICISYSLPISLSFGVVSGFRETGEIKNIFDKTGIKAEEISPENVRNMEFSKLFLNLIGMASATHGFSVGQGFQDPEIFREEAEMLREYVKIVQAEGGNFLNFSHYPVKLLASLFKILPIKFLLVFRGQIGKLIEKGRKGKRKDLDEIEYYNGAVVNLGKKIGLPASINQKIVERVLYKR